MASKPGQADQVRALEEVTTMEDHLVDGGFGSWMFEALREEPRLIARLRTVALSPEVCGAVGSQTMLNALGGLA